MRPKLKIETTFDFGKLAEKLPEILEKYSHSGAEALAKNARSMIKDGKLRSVTKGTMEIARKGWSRKRKSPRAGTRQQALLHSGSALASIKAIDGEVHAAGYLKYHMDGHEIVSNKWTKKYLKNLDKELPKKIKPRNPFFTSKGELRKSVKNQLQHSKTDGIKAIYRLIAKALKK